MTRTSEAFTALVSADNLSPMRRLSGVLCLFFAVSAAMLSAQQAKDVAGSRDHPMISRFDGAVIKQFEQKEFDEYWLVTGPVASHQPNGEPWEGGIVVNKANSVVLEGRVWRLTYDVPPNRSTLEVVRTYQAALKKSGFEVLFQCDLNECAGGPPPAKVNALGWYGTLSKMLMYRSGYSISFGNKVDQRFVSARLKRKEGDIYVSVLALTLREPMVLLDVVEVKPLTADGVTVNATTMATNIAAQGSVALYGIHFDNDRAEVKPESRGTISEIAALLKQNATIELVVVGHTDKNGTLEHNLDLSLRRAQAVVAVLTSEFGVNKSRLEPRGVGFLAPVASNTTEENRAKNRRVELVER